MGGWEVSWSNYRRRRRAIGGGVGRGEQRENAPASWQVGFFILEFRVLGLEVPSVDLFPCDQGGRKSSDNVCNMPHLHTTRDSCEKDAKISAISEPPCPALYRSRA